MATGFRIVSPISKVFKGMRDAVPAHAFSPEVRTFLKRTLTTAIQLTPARPLGLIKKAQRKQYSNRVSYIPSIHELNDPTLIVKENGDQWLYHRSKWYRPDLWSIPDEAYSVYLELVRERDRRLETKREDFIAFRAQARFLYKKSWYDIGQSVGLDIPCAAPVKSATSRRTKSQLQNGHKQNPPKGYAQERGGKGIYSIVVYNPFLQEQTTYWQLSGKAILAQAMQKHQDMFNNEVAEKQTKAILRILRALLA